MRVLRTDVSRETELSGTSDELLRLARAIPSKRATFGLENQSDPSPYARSLAVLELMLTSGKVAISVSADGETLEIRGGDESLEILATNIESIAMDGDEKAHLHIDYFPDHFYLAEDSEPLVIALNAAI